jgi:hypothetical protein
MFNSQEEAFKDIDRSNFVLKQIDEDEFQILPSRKLKHFIKLNKEGIIFSLVTISLNLFYLYKNRNKSFSELNELYIKLIPINFIVTLYFPILLLYIFFFVIGKNPITINSDTMEVHTPEDDFIIKPNQSLHLIKDFDDEISLYIADNEEIVIFLDYQWKENRINDLLKLKFSGIATEIEQYEKSHNKFYTEYYKKIEKQEISRVQFNYENRKLAFIFALLL